MSAAAAEKQRTACVFFSSPSTPSLDEHGDKLGREKQKQNAPAHVTHGIPGLNGIATAVMANYTIALYTWFDVESLSIGRRPFQLAGNHGDHCASCSLAG